MKRRILHNKYLLTLFTDLVSIDFLIEKLPYKSKVAANIRTKARISHVFYIALQI